MLIISKIYRFLAASQFNSAKMEIICNNLDFNSVEEKRVFLVIQNVFVIFHANTKPFKIFRRYCYKTISQEEKMPENKPKKIGLALSGGGTYAIFQVGVLEALTENSPKGFLLDKQVKGISGTSGGAVNAVFLAFDNMSLCRLKKFWEENNLESIAKHCTEYLESHFERVGQMNAREIETNDVDDIPRIYSNFLLDQVNEAIVSLSNTFGAAQNEISQKYYNGVKILENLSSMFFPGLKDISQVPKKIIQKIVRIYFREILAKYLLNEEQKKDRAACYRRIRSLNKNDEFSKISVFIGATNISNSQDHFFSSLSLEDAKHLWKFAGERYRYAISIESILACATMPEIYPAKRLFSYPLFEKLGYDAESNTIYYKHRFRNKGHWGCIDKNTGKEIDNKTEGVYWDGYFLSNPSLEPLVRLRCVEILLIRLASVEDDTIPHHDEEIINRKEILAQNVTIQREIQSIRLKNEHLEATRQFLPDRDYRNFIRVHEIRFSKDNVLDQGINNPSQSREYIELGHLAGQFFKKAYENLHAIIEENDLNLSTEYAEIIVVGDYEHKKLKLTLRDCINDHTYEIENF